jgi:spore germination protein YaaH
MVIDRFTRRILLLFSIILVLGLGGSFFIWWRLPVVILSPLTSTSTFRFKSEPPAPKGNKVIYGFLPYWNTTKVTLQPELTHLSYFGLTIAADGSIVTRADSTSAEPGYNRLGSDALLDLTASSSAKYEIVFAQFDPEIITSFLSSPKAHQKFLDSIDSLLLAYPVSGINIDIEYAGTVNDPLRARFVEFMALLRSHLNEKYSGVTLSIDMFASAAGRYTIWDVEALAPHVDYIIVMAYDFHRRSSVVAGPVAPLFGGKELWDSDISQYLQDYLAVVPSHKILLGVPFYGYEWQTTTRDSQAHTFPDTGSTASFDRVQELLKKKTQLSVQEHWNEAALSPYLSYKEKGEIFVVYYENSRSISYKLDYVNQLDLGGIAIWALGYEGDSRELWDVINRKLVAKP